MADEVEETAGDDLQTAAAAFGKILAAAPEAPAKPEQSETPPQAEAQTNAQEEGANVTDEASEPTVDEDTASEAVETAEATPQADEPQVVTPAPVDDTNAKTADETQKTLTFARALLNQLHGQLMGEFADIKSMEDLYKVGEVDPVRYNRFVLAQQKMQAAVQTYQQVEKQAKDAEAAASPTPKIDWAAEKAKLDKFVPELADPKTGPQLERDLNAYAKANGIDPTGKTAAEIKILYQAWKAQNASATQAKALEAAKAKAKDAPKVQTPGTAKPKSSAKEDKANEAFSRLQKTGHDRDAADVFRHIFAN